MRMLRFPCMMLCLLLCSFRAYPHEVRPASLDIIEAAQGTLEFRWRQPIKGEYTISISPILSSGWLDREPDERIVTDNSLIRVWHLQQPAQALAGQDLIISGLNRTITDVLVTIRYANGDTFTHLIKAATPSMQIPAQGATGAAVPEYLWLGLTHIWSGPDHLLYVLSLLLLIHSRRSLLVTISSFTLAHSITLVCAALDLVRLPAAPVEAVISLSIVYIAVELVRLRAGEFSLAAQRPWLIAFIFGLLHGFGFAGALQEIGLPQQAVAIALLLFNIGIELGQLLFVALMLGLGWLALQLLPSLRKPVEKLMPYPIGVIASYWLFERLFLLV